MNARYPLSFAAQKQDHVEFIRESLYKTALTWDN